MNKLSSSLHILLTDDHSFIRRGLRELLTEEFGAIQVDEASNLQETLRHLKSNKVDLLVTDISMPGTNGIDLVKQVKLLYSDLPILILSMHSEEQYGIRSLKAGASGYLNKESAPEEFIKAVREILDGKKYISNSMANLLADAFGGIGPGELHDSLSDREFEVLKQLAVGHSISVIGNSLSLSPNTISTYRARVLEKMGMRSNSELIQYCIQKGLI